jgi:hypothetical protein
MQTLILRELNRILIDNGMETVIDTSLRCIYLKGCSLTDEQTPNKRRIKCWTH